MGQSCNSSFFVNLDSSANFSLRPPHLILSDVTSILAESEIVQSFPASHPCPQLAHFLLWYIGSAV